MEQQQSKEMVSIEEEVKAAITQHVTLTYPILAGLWKMIGMKSFCEKGYEGSVTNMLASDPMAQSLAQTIIRCNINASEFHFLKVESTAELIDGRLALADRSRYGAIVSTKDDIVTIRYLDLAWL